MEKRYARLSMLMALVLCFSLLLTACAGGGGASSTAAAPAAASTAADSEAADAGGDAATGEAIKIGLIQPLTGGIAATGIAIRDAALIYQDYINANGGINGRPLELIVEDSANDPTMASNAMNKLLTQDHVPAVIGVWGSSPTLAAIPLAREHEVPLLVETASNYKVTDKDEEGGPWIFRLSAPSMMEVAVLKDILKDEMGFEFPYLVGSNNDWGHGNDAEFRELYEVEYGTSVAGSDFIEPTDNEFSAILAKIQSSGADSVILTGDAAQIAMIVEQAYNLGLDLRYLGLGMAASVYKIQQLAGDAATNGYFQTASFVGNVDPAMSENPEMAAYFTEQWLAHGYELMEIQEAARGFDATFVMCEAMKTIDGEITSDAIREALSNLQVSSMSYGNVSFTEWGNFINQNVTPVGILGFENNEVFVHLKPIYPVYHG